jgi:tetratricopeptide (TPR) repeat protein
MIVPWLWRYGPFLGSAYSTRRGRAVGRPDAVARLRNLHRDCLRSLGGAAADPSAGPDDGRDRDAVRYWPALDQRDEPGCTSDRAWATSMRMQSTTSSKFPANREFSRLADKFDRLVRLLGLAVLWRIDFQESGLRAVYIRRLERLMWLSCSGKPERESVTDRAASILRWGFIVRFGAGRVVWQSCRAVAGAAINVACTALLAIVPPRPDLLLTTAHICLQLRRPRRAYDAVAGMNVIDAWHIADPNRTAQLMTNIAEALCACGLRAEAKDVLRKTIALAPHSATPQSALIFLLEADLRAAGGNIPLEQWAELEDLLRKSVIESPHLAAPRLALAACLRREARYLEAQTAPARIAAPGLRVEAENLLWEAVTEEPCRSAPRLALAEFLLENLRYAEAETVAAAAVQCCPTSAEPRLVLARIQFQLLRFEAAAKTIEALLAIAPENGWAWFEYGKILWNSFDQPDGAFERAGDLSGNDSALLAGVAQQFLYDLEYEKAAKYYERLLNLHPSMRDNFVICRYYATCLKEIGRTQEAVDIISAALKSCRLAAKRAQGEGLELIKREEALLLSQAGRLDASFSSLQSIREVAAPSPRYDRAEYLPRTPERLQRLAEIVDSRDVFVLLQGPSFATFAARLHEFADFEFAIATLNSFPPVEQELRRIKRHADILLFTQPGSVRSWHPELMKFLARSPPNLVVANRYALSGLSGFGVSEREFVARHDKRLLLVHSDGGPPLPSRPLHFENGPSVSLLIPLLLFARPRRIFLFGADGGSNPNFGKRPYFYYDDYDADEPQESLNRPGMVSFKGLPRKLEGYNRRQHVNAINGDRVIDFAFRSLEAHFGIQVPPIFNVCPHSTHRIFPRINIDAALAQFADGRAAAAARDYEHHVR